MKESPSVNPRSAIVAETITPSNFSPSLCADVITRLI